MDFDPIALVIFTNSAHQLAYQKKTMKRGLIVNLSQNMTKITPRMLERWVYKVVVSN